MLIGIGAAAGVVVLPRLRVDPCDQRSRSCLLPVGGLCVAPWLTMVCRSTMAGTVFTLALPGTLTTATQLFYLFAFKRVAPPESRPRSSCGAGTLGFCAIGR